MALNDMRPPFRVIVERKELVGCEIGVATGENTKLIFDNLDIQKMYLVDICFCMPEVNHGDYDLHKRNFLITKENLKDYHDKLVWIGKKSQDVSDQEIPRNSLDFVYIDGDHHCEAVKEDIRRYLPRLKQPGLMAGHDWGNGDGDVPDAVKAIFWMGLVTVAGNDWWVWK